MTDGPVIHEAQRRLHIAQQEERRLALVAAEKKRLEAGEPKAAKTMRIEVYACPTPGCPDYFGHLGMPDIGARAIGTKDLNYTAKPENQHRTRATCPTCFARDGSRVERIRVTGIVRVPQTDDAAAPMPESTGIHA